MNTSSNRFEVITHCVSVERAVDTPCGAISRIGRHSKATRDGESFIHQSNARGLSGRERDYATIDNPSRRHRRYRYRYTHTHGPYRDYGSHDQDRSRPGLCDVVRGWSPFPPGSALMETGTPTLPGGKLAASIRRLPRWSAAHVARNQPMISAFARIVGNRRSPRWSALHAPRSRRLSLASVHTVGRPLLPHRP